MMLVDNNVAPEGAGSRRRGETTPAPITFKLAHTGVHDAKHKEERPV
jgi:hypothetical protein